MKRNIRKVKALLSVRNGRKQMVFLSGAILVGVVSSYFAVAVDTVSEFFDIYIRPHKYLPLLICPLVFAISAGVTKSFFPAARGSGIPQVIAARISRDNESRKHLIGLRVACAKMLLTVIGVMGGASIGREGPTVQIGAAIMLFCATFGGIKSQRGVVLAGAAAGVAAAFNTPLAGIVFAIEEMARAFEHRNSSIVLIAIVFAGAAAMSIMGNYDYFGYTNVVLKLVDSWPAIIVIGIAGGIGGGIFARMLINGEPLLRKYFGRCPYIIFAAFCGLVVALIGLSTNGLTYGSGYGIGHALLHGQLAPEWWQMPAKLLATAFSSISGIPGGIFSPSLSVGAAMGADLSQWFPLTPLPGAVLLGMAAYFAGVTQAPITAFVIVLEITGKATDAVPLIAAAALAAGVSRLISPHSLYHALAKRFILLPVAAKA